MATTIFWLGIQVGILHFSIYLRIFLVSHAQQISARWPSRHRWIFVLAFLLCPGTRAASGRIWDAGKRWDPLAKYPVNGILNPLGIKEFAMQATVCLQITSPKWCAFPIALLSRIISDYLGGSQGSQGSQGPPNGMVNPCESSFPPWNCHPFRATWEPIFRHIGGLPGWPSAVKFPSKPWCIAQELLFFLGRIYCSYLFFAQQQRLAMFHDGSWCFIFCDRTWHHASYVWLINLINDHYAIPVGLQSILNPNHHGQNLEDVRTGLPIWSPHVGWSSHPLLDDHGPGNWNHSGNWGKYQLHAVCSGGSIRGHEWVSDMGIFGKLIHIFKVKFYGKPCFFFHQIWGFAVNLDKFHLKPIHWILSKWWLITGVSGTWKELDTAWSPEKSLLMLFFLFGLLLFRETQTSPEIVFLFGGKSSIPSHPLPYSRMNEKAQFRVFRLVPCQVGSPYFIGHCCIFTMSYGSCILIIWQFGYFLQYRVGFESTNIYSDTFTNLFCCSHSTFSWLVQTRFSFCICIALGHYILGWFYPSVCCFNLPVIDSLVVTSKSQPL